MKVESWGQSPNFVINFFLEGADSCLAMTEEFHLTWFDHLSHCKVILIVENSADAQIFRAIKAEFSFDRFLRLQIVDDSVGPRLVKWAVESQNAIATFLQDRFSKFL